MSAAIFGSSSTTRIRIAASLPSRRPRRGSKGLSLKLLISGTRSSKGRRRGYDHAHASPPEEPGMGHKVSLAAARLRRRSRSRPPWRCRVRTWGSHGDDVERDGPGRPDAAPEAPTVQVDTVYVAAPPPQETITVHKVIRSSGEDGSEHESEGDDCDGRPSVRRSTARDAGRPPRRPVRSPRDRRPHGRSRPAVPSPTRPCPVGARSRRSRAPTRDRSASPSDSPGWRPRVPSSARSLRHRPGRCRCRDDRDRHHRRRRPDAARPARHPLRPARARADRATAGRRPAGARPPTPRRGRHDEAVGQVMTTRTLAPDTVSTTTRAHEPPDLVSRSVPLMGGRVGVHVSPADGSARSEASAEADASSDGSPRGRIA